MRVNLNKIDNTTVENSNVIIRQVSKNTNIIDNITRANVNQYNINIIHNILVDFDYMSVALDADGVGDIQKQYIKFETTIDKIDEKIIPFIDVILVYEQIGDDVSTLTIPYEGLVLYNPRDNLSGYREADYTDLSYANVYQIGDIVDSVFKSVKILTTLYIGNTWALLPQFRAKLMVSIKNPTQLLRVD